MNIGHEHEQTPRVRRPRRMRKEDAPLTRRGILIDYILDLETEGWDTFVLGGLFDVFHDRMEFYDHTQEQSLVDRLLALADEVIFDPETKKRREITIWAHNGGRYDALWLCDWLVKLGVPAKVFASSARITLLRIGTSLAIRDSAGLVPMSLEMGAKIGRVPKSKTGLPCRCCKICCAPESEIEIPVYTPEGMRICRRELAPGGKCKGDCGGYCSIARDMTPEYWQLVKTYLEQDCRATASMLEGLESYAKEKDLDLCGTVGASSWTTARRRYNLPRAKWNPKHYRFAREGYYGGRTQVFRPRSRRGHRYDINAAYPAALATIRLPVGKPRLINGDKARASFYAGVEGIYRCTVVVSPETHIPPLPWRAKDGRLHYPVGRFSGTWTRTELAHALSLGTQQGGIAGSCEALSWGEALVWDQSEEVLAPYAKLVWALRDSARSWEEIERWWQTPIGCPAGKSSPMGKWLKWDANSVTGKLAQRPDTEECVMAPENPKPCPGGAWCELGLAPGASRLCGAGVVGRVPTMQDTKGAKPCGLDENGMPVAGDSCCNHRCTRSCGRYDALDKLGTVWTRPVWRIPDNGHVHWAAYLTAHARIQLHTQLISDGQGGRTCVYCDTDSCYAETERDWNIGKQLGQWDSEGTYTDFEALAPKTYSFIDGKGERQVRAKGMFDPDWTMLRRKEKIPVDRGVNQFKSAVRAGDGLFKRRDFTRSSQHDGIHFGDRMFDEASGMTLPQWTTEQVEERMAI